jgi:hypothetical protein
VTILAPCPAHNKSSNSKNQCRHYGTKLQYFNDAHASCRRIRVCFKFCVCCYTLRPIRISVALRKEREKQALPFSKSPFFREGYPGKDGTEVRV